MTIRELRRDELADERRLPPELTVVLLHHAGGSAAAYLPFAWRLPRRWRLLGLELPARFPSARQPACRTMRQAVDWMTGAVWAETSGPVAVFGHSLGALLAYELARALDERGRTPVWLGLSACAAPHLLPGPGDRRHAWPHERLVQYMRRLGGTPDNAWQQPHVPQCATRRLRNDLAIVDSYRHEPGTPLNVPVSVYSGSADPVVSDSDLKPWIDYAAEVEFHTWPGNHFYLFERADEVCARMVQDIRAAQIDRRVGALSRV